MNTNTLPKELFVSTLNFITAMDTKFDDLCTSLEALSPGEYVNFFPNFQYNNIIIDLICASFTPSEREFFYYWYYECDAGQTYLQHIKHYSSECPPISSFEDLYDFLAYPLEYLEKHAKELIYNV